MSTKTKFNTGNLQLEQLQQALPSRTRTDYDMPFYVLTIESIDG